MRTGTTGEFLLTYLEEVHRIHEEEGRRMPEAALELYEKLRNDPNP